MDDITRLHGGEDVEKEVVVEMEPELKEGPATEEDLRELCEVLSALNLPFWQKVRVQDGSAHVSEDGYLHLRHSKEWVVSSEQSCGYSEDTGTTTTRQWTVAPSGIIRSGALALTSWRVVNFEIDPLYGGTNVGPVDKAPDASFIESLWREAMFTHEEEQAKLLAAPPGTVISKELAKWWEGLDL